MISKFYQGVKKSLSERTRHHIVLATGIFLLFGFVTACQQSATEAPQPTQTAEKTSGYAGKKILWVNAYNDTYSAPGSTTDNANVRPSSSCRASGGASSSRNNGRRDLPCSELASKSASAKLGAVNSHIAKKHRYLLIHPSSGRLVPYGIFSTRCWLRSNQSID